MSLGSGGEIWLLENGKKAAWLDAPQHPDAKGDGAMALKIMEINNCTITSKELKSAVSNVGVTPSGAVVVVSEKSVQAIMRDGRREWEALGASGSIRHAVVSTDGAWIGASLDDGTVVVGRPGEAKPRLKLRADPGE